MVARSLGSEPIPQDFPDLGGYPPKTHPKTGSPKYGRVPPFGKCVFRNLKANPTGSTPSRRATPCFVNYTQGNGCQNIKAAHPKIYPRFSSLGEGTPRPTQTPRRVQNISCHHECTEPPVQRNLAHFVITLTQPVRRPQPVMI